MGDGPDERYPTYVGFDVHKATVCVAIAEGGRVVRYGRSGFSRTVQRILSKVVARLGMSGRHLSFCYEAGPCGYGLHRMLIGFGHSCIVRPYVRSWG